MINKQQWSILPADMIKKKFWLRLSLIGLVPQANHRPSMISDYSYFDVNIDTLNIAPTEATHKSNGVGVIATRFLS